VTARPGARFGPTGIRLGSRRIYAAGAWNIYTGETFSLVVLDTYLIYLVLNESLMLGENPLQSWARILDCGDAPLTFLDNTIALKQLQKAHTVCSRFRPLGQSVVR